MVESKQVNSRGASGMGGGGGSDAMMAMSGAIQRPSETARSTMRVGVMSCNRVWSPVSIPSQPSCLRCLAAGSSRLKVGVAEVTRAGQCGTLYDEAGGVGVDCALVTRQV
jgi:hypothetical protein